METRVLEDARRTPDVICELKSQVELFKRKLEVIGLFNLPEPITVTMETPS